MAEIFTALMHNEFWQKTVCDWCGKELKGNSIDSDEGDFCCEEHEEEYLNDRGYINENGEDHSA